MADSLTLTGLLALYGAILSSFGFGWNVYRDRLDKPRLKISIGIRRIVQSPDGKWYQVQPDLPIEGASKKLFLVVNVANIGRRPVKWMGWGGRYRKKEPTGGAFIIQPVGLPAMLNEGESRSEFTDDLKAASANVKELFIYDSTGKNWRLSNRQLRKLKEECRVIQLASRGHQAIRREVGKPDVLTHFPNDASATDAVLWCEADGYKVIGHEIVETPEDENFKSTFVVSVEHGRSSLQK